jgi:hypothetical protein
MPVPHLTATSMISCADGRSDEDVDLDQCELGDAEPVGPAARESEHH